MDIGRINTLRINRLTDFGFFLADNDGNEVLFPKSYITPAHKIDDMIDVFVYHDSEDRIVATSEIPKAQVEEFAVLEITDVNPRIGAFADLGLYGKELLIPFAEQKQKLEKGEKAVVYILVDDLTQRLVGSTKIEDFLFFEDIPLEKAQEAQILVYRKTPLGYSVVVNNMFYGLIFNGDVTKPLQVGDSLTAYVKNIRPDGKLDMVLSPIGFQENSKVATQVILDRLKANNGVLQLHDKSDPEEVRRQLGMSKKSFKAAVGMLYKQKRILIKTDSISLIT